jgi:flagellar motor switch protein FliN
LSEDNIIRAIGAFDEVFSVQGSSLVEKIFNAPVNVETRDTVLFDLELVKSLIGEKAIRVDLAVSKKNLGFIYLAKSALLEELSTYLEQEGKNASKVPESMQLLLDIAEQLSATKKECLSTALGKQAEFANPSILLWNGEAELAFTQGYVTPFEVKIGDMASFTLVRIIPELLTRDLFKDTLVDQQVYTAEKKGFEELDGNGQSDGNGQPIDFIHDLELNISVELGRVDMMLKDVLQLGKGSIVELNKFAGEPVDVFVNNKKFAQGEVVVIDQNFAVRLTQLSSKKERIDSLIAQQ